MEDEVVELNFDEYGKRGADKNDKIALVDADTMAYVACLNCQQESYLLPQSEYTEEEWEGIISNNTYDPMGGTYRTLDIDIAYKVCVDKIDALLHITGCREVELHFTGGRDNFRYKIYPNYKANRAGKASPAGLSELKEKLLTTYKGSIATEYEADDIVVLKKKLYTDKYILCASDKDILYSVVGTHLNTYTRVDTDMKWVTVDEKTTRYWTALQTIAGDAVDNIKGLPRAGFQFICKLFRDEPLPIGVMTKTSDKKLQDLIPYLKDLTEEEIWDITEKAFKARGYDRDYILLQRNLVDMNLLTERVSNLGDIDYRIKLKD